MRIVNYKRFILSMIIIFLMASLSVNIVFSMVMPKPAPEPVYHAHIVKTGETVWEIAKTYVGTEDIRDYVYQIARANALENFAIYPGQTLNIPVN